MDAVVFIMFLSGSFVILLSTIVLYINVQATANLDEYDVHNHAVKHEALSTGKHLSDYNQHSNEYSESWNRGTQHDSQLPEEWLNVPNWPAPETLRLGQVSGITINSKGEVLVFHRGNHAWNGQAFDVNDNYLQRERGPILFPTVLVYHPESGAVLQQWGENMFYMPHGISVDHEDNLWLTDVALHQVFKFPPLHKNPKSAYLQLGIAFKPGNSAEQFCKPTSVAVTPSGDFFVADGYCNSRIVKFNSAGVKLSEWGRSTIVHGLAMPEPYHMEIPHALTLAEDKGLVCVADRENGRVQCFDWHNGTFAYQLYSSKFGSRVFSVTYSPLQGGMFFLVNGPELKQFGVDVRGFVVSASTKQPISMFGLDLKNPHDIAVSADAMNIYVADIGPLKISKYTRNTSFSPIPTSSQPILLKSAQTIEWLNVPNWPAPETLRLGQVSGITINSKGEVLVFHTGNHVWNGQAFDVNDNYLQRERGPIIFPTVLVYHPESGAVLQQWGENMFYMPHGISVDHEDNLWLTDVALHQVFKFPPLHKNPKSAYLQLGIAFKPGNSAEQFCKPTSVAVTPSGDFFVADGYCNSRIVKFNSAGVKLSEWGRSTIVHGLAMPEPYHMEIPHALTLAEDKGLVCVADRENGRVQCFDWHNGTFAYQLYSSKFGSRVFSVTYSPLQGGMFFLVNGPELKQFGVDVRGFVVSASTKQPISMFGLDLKNPHDIAVSADAMNIYVAEIGPLKISKYTRSQYQTSIYK